MATLQDALRSVIPSISVEDPMEQVIRCLFPVTPPMSEEACFEYVSSLSPEAIPDEAKANVGQVVQEIYLESRNFPGLRRRSLEVLMALRKS